MTDQIPEAPILPARRSLLDRVSIVWLIPALALVIALAIAWHSYSQRGALIEITFKNASGITAQQTELRYREVTVGKVERVAFSDDLSQVVAHVRIDKDIEPFVDDELKFWVVRPEVSTRGITGLDTVLSGVYIEGSWDGVPGGLHRQFVGLDNAPILRPDQHGTEIVLKTATGRGLHEGTPILYMGLEVGRVGQPELAPDGATIQAPAVVFAPHDRLLTTQSRFWNVSGVSFKIGTSGASVDFASLASLVTGGISFETVVSGGDPATSDSAFVVYDDQDAARGSFFDSSGDDSKRVQISVVFEQNVTGLEVGAPVTLRGLEIGEVVSLTGRIDPELFGDDRVRLVVVMSIRLDELKIEGGTDEAAVLDFFEKSANEGWRAQLARGSLLTGGLRIEIVEVPDAKPATFVRDAEPFPIFPSETVDLPSSSATAEGLLKRVSDLPVEDLLKSAIAFMDNAATLVASPDIQSIPREVSGLIGDVRDVVGSEPIRALPDKLAAIASDFQGVLDDLKAQEGVSKLVAAVENAGQAAHEVSLSMEGVPALIERIDAVAAKAEALDLELLLAEATGLVESANGILGGDAARALPETLTTALGGVDDAVTQVTTLLTDLNQAEAAAKLTQAIELAANAAAGIETASAGLPDLIDRIDAVAAKVEAADIDQLVSEATGLMASADALIGTDLARALPESLGSALDQVGAALAELRAGGTVENVNATLESARGAAELIATATDDLPALVSRTETVLAEAERALSGLAETGSLNRDTREAMREVTRAAEAVRSLARMLERKPNALLTGK